MVAGLLDRATGGGGAAVTAPKVTLRLGGGGAAGALGALGALVGLPEGGLGERVVAATLTRGLLPVLDMAEVHLAPGPAPAGPLAPGSGDLPALGDPLALDLTVGDASASFAATVVEREPRARGAARLVLANGGAALARVRLDECHTDRTPGAIVADIAAKAGIEASGLDGEALPRFVLDRATPGHVAVARLAAMAGAVAAFDAAGALKLIDDTATGEPSARLVAGETLLDWHLTERQPPTGRLTVDGAGVEGAPRWAWLRKEAGPMRAEVGGGDPARRIAAPAVRDPAGAGALAGALGRAGARSAARARFLATGQPAVVPGGTVAVEGVPGAATAWLVLRVTHRFGVSGGLMTEIAAAPAGAGGGLLSALGGLL